MDIVSYLLGKKASGGGGGSKGLNWEQIGYTQEPQIVQKGFNHAKNIYDNWDYTETNMANKFQRDNDLIYFPNISPISNITSTTYMFGYCMFLEEIDKLEITVAQSIISSFDATYMFINNSQLKRIGNLTMIMDNGTGINLDYAFQNCTNLKDASNINISRVRSMVSMFQGCSSLEDVPVFTYNGISSGMQNAFKNCTKLTDESLDNILQMCINSRGISSSNKTLSYLGFKTSDYPVSRLETLPHYSDFINAGWSVGY